VHRGGFFSGFAGSLTLSQFNMSFLTFSMPIFVNNDVFGIAKSLSYFSFFLLPNTATWWGREEVALERRARNGCRCYPLPLALTVYQEVLQIAILKLPTILSASLS